LSVPFFLKGGEKMEKVSKAIDKLSQLFGIISGVIMLCGVILVIAEILARTLFDSTLYITEEYTAYFMVAITFLGLAYTLKEKGHIRMVFLHNIVKGGKARAYLDLYSFVVGLIIFFIITVVSTEFFWDSIVSGSRSMQISKTYLAIPQFAMPLGSLLITLQFASELIKTVLKLRTGEFGDGEVESKELGR
jgi:TRAP-type C4-dicarboxylate transport system permease small subunit